MTVDPDAFTPKMGSHEGSTDKSLEISYLLFWLLKVTVCMCCAPLPGIGCQSHILCIDLLTHSYNHTAALY